jgi:predicted AAA+ superfamily ATPase
MIKQIIADAIMGGIDGNRILYVSIDTPIYSGISLENFVRLLPNNDTGRSVVIFDEIQYLRDWEIHLKDLVDSYPHIKFIASGSAAAALQLKSKESGAGRFSEFMLPPLTFFEFLSFLGEDEKYIYFPSQHSESQPEVYVIKDMAGLNNRFIDYLNYGGYPEAAVNPAIRNNPDQFDLPQTKWTRVKPLLVPFALA